MKYVVVAGLLIAILASFGCAPKIPANAVTENGVTFTHTPVSIYPAAAYVEVFATKNVQYTNKGYAITDDTAGIRLTDEQRKRFEASFYIKHIYKGEDGKEVVGCFEPHHFFRYYAQDGRQVGEIQVCFCCGGVVSKPQIFPATKPNEWGDWDLASIKAVVQSMNVPTEGFCGDNP